MAQPLLVSNAPGPRPPGATVAQYPTHEVHQAIGGSIDSVRQEVDDAFADMKTFYQNEPDHVMRLAQGHSARLSELRVLIMRIEDQLPIWKNVRMRDIEPAIDELWKQYQISSRLQSARELDWRIESGER